MSTSVPRPTITTTCDESGGAQQCGARSFRTVAGLAQGESSPGEFPWTCALFKRDQKSGEEEFLGNCALVPNHNDVMVATAASVLKLMGPE